MEVSLFVYKAEECVTDKCRETQAALQATLQHKVHAQTERYAASGIYLTVLINRMERLRKEVAAIEDEIEDVK